MGKKWPERQMMALLLIALIVLFFFLLRVVLPFFFALFLAILIEPAVAWLEKKGATRAGAVLVVFILLGLTSAVLIVWLIPGLIADLNLALARLPEYIRVIQDWLLKANQEYKRFRLPQTIRQVGDEALLRGEETLRQLLMNAGGAILSFFSQFLILLLVPILTFYFSLDLKKLQQQAAYWSHQFFREDQRVVGEIAQVVISYLRAQALASLEVGLLLIIGLLFLRVDLAILIGFLAGVLNLIPYFGPILGAAPAVFLAAQDSFWKALYVVILFFLVNQLEAAVILPKVVGERIGLPPLAVIFLLLIGGELFGFVGIIFAVPVGAVLQVIFRYYWKRRPGKGYD